VWLRTDPQECAKRIRSREREGEDGIDVAYLRALEAQQQQWLGGGGGGGGELPLLPCAEVRDTGEAGVAAVRKFIEGLQTEVEE